MITGIKKLDAFLDTVENGVLINIFGARGTGKTQLSMQISINLLQNRSGQIIYHDITGDFRPEKMAKIIEKYGMNMNLLDRVKILRIINTAEQMDHIQNMQFSDILLLVIDDVTDLFSFEYKNKFEKHTLFMKYMHCLSLIAIKKKIPIIVTNNTSQINRTEFEHMKNIVDMYAHIKICLQKNNKKYYGTLSTPWALESFYYQINYNGICIDK